MAREVDRTFSPKEKADSESQADHALLGRISQLEEEQDNLLQEIEALRKANICKDNFLATLGHELRNPLAAISGGVQIMKLAPAKRDWALEMIDYNLYVLTALLDDLMDLTRIENDKINLNIKTTSLRDCLQHIADSARSMVATKHQNLILDLPEDDIYIEADPVRLGQVVNNLLINASKYTPEYGTLRLNLNQNKKQAVIEVEDNGIGIPEDMREAIFEPFVQIKNTVNAGGGMGIGLALVKRITDLLGGQVTIEEGRDQTGSKFSVSFPLSEGAGGKSDTEKTDEDASQQKGILSPDYRVLIIDDNRDTATTMQAMLENEGAEVQIALDAATGLAKARSFQPDCLIVDIGLPDMDGHDLVGLLKKECRKASLCIALTGYGYEGAQDRAKMAGFDHYLIKPAAWGQLIGLLAVSRDQSSLTSIQNG